MYIAEEEEEDHNTHKRGLGRFFLRDPPEIGNLDTHFCSEDDFLFNVYQIIFFWILKRGFKAYFEHNNPPICAL